jgi:hypothetical protein
MGGYRWRGQGHGAVLVSGGRRGLARCRYDEECAAGIALGWRAVAGVLAHLNEHLLQVPAHWGAAACTLKRTAGWASVTCASDARGSHLPGWR